MGVCAVEEKGKEVGGGGGGSECVSGCASRFVKTIF